jgi:homoserine kinase
MRMQELKGGVTLPCCERFWRSGLGSNAAAAMAGLKTTAGTCKSRVTYNRF